MPGRMTGRTALITALVFGVFVFTVAAILMARALTDAGTERARVLDVLEAQAAGDAQAVLAALPACAAQPVCVRTTRQRVDDLARQGRVEILRYDPSVRVALTNTTGTGRVAWRVGDALPIVQCVRVRRKNPLSGERVELVALSNPRPRQSSC